MKKTRLFSRIGIRTAVLGMVVLCVVLGGIYLGRSGRSFHTAYQTYAGLAKAHVDAAYVPGIPDNPVRQHLNTVLTRVLAQSMTPAERLALAEEGLSTLKDAEVQIDAIGDLGEKVQNAIFYMNDKSSSPGVFLSKEKTHAIVLLAKEEFEIVADIRGLSYGANFHTAEIFNRIVLDKGELTPSYVADLNKEVPLVEEQFNKRANLYRRLEDVVARMQKAAVGL